MYLLLGKYESNAIALKIYADNCDGLIHAYEQLVTVLTKHRGEPTAFRYISLYITAWYTSLFREKFFIL